MKRGFLFTSFVLAVVLVSLTYGVAQSSAQPAAQASAASKQALTIDDIVKMTKAGLSDDIIVQDIRRTGQPFDLTTDQLLQLKAASVSDRVIKAMLDPKSADLAANIPGTSAKQSTVDPSLPTEVGVYAKKKGEWVEVLPEVVNWKTGGVLKSVATAGVVKGDVNGHLNGQNSQNSVTTPADFIIIVPEGTAITEYQLLHLRQNGSNREFRTVTGGVFHVSGGATRDLMTFEGKKIAPRTYSVTFAANLSAGEYGFLPPGAVVDRNAAGSSGKLYSFRVVE